MNSIINQTMKHITLTPTNLPASQDEVDWYKIVLGERGFIHPQTYIQSMVEYYNTKGWPATDPKQLMRYWMFGAETKHGLLPNLNETECAYMQQFLKEIGTCWVHRFCEIFRGIQLTAQKAVLLFDLYDINALAKWLADCNMDIKMSAFCPELSIRSVHAAS